MDHVGGPGRHKRNLAFRHAAELSLLSRSYATPGSTSRGGDSPIAGVAILATSSLISRREPSMRRARRNDLVEPLGKRPFGQYPRTVRGRYPRVVRAYARTEARAQAVL